MKNLKDYVDQTDSFQNNALLNCCFNNFASSKESRKECIQTLIEYGANVNQKNIKTKWTIIFWLCHWGDEKSIEYLFALKD